MKTAGEKKNLLVNVRPMQVTNRHAAYTNRHNLFNHCYYTAVTSSD